ncbi:uncharacterized protein IWZ02DRAFT_80049 [Phyllosticta citriasiana]|uniref:Uncharacterized protein n=1 Tax=Phyllosticta citriasiana TaxID=595635 RepID=A0ABR1KP29_9PEZI
MGWVDGWCSDDMGTNGLSIFLLSISIFSFLTLSLFSLFLTFPYLLFSNHYPVKICLFPLHFITASYLAVCIHGSSFSNVDRGKKALGTGHGWWIG